MFFCCLLVGRIGCFLWLGRMWIVGCRGDWIVGVLFCAVFLLPIAGGGMVILLACCRGGVYFFADDSAGLFDANGSGVPQDVDDLAGV